MATRRCCTHQCAFIDVVLACNYGYGESPKNNGIHHCLVGSTAGAYRQSLYSLKMEKLVNGLHEYYTTVSNRSRW